MKTGLAFVLHMHQPYYVDPATGRAVLPWVRLHGARGYLDVAQILDEFPAMRMTVNFVPSLVEQLLAVVRGELDDWSLRAKRPVAELSPEEKQALVASMFSVHWGRAVETRPRYRALLEKRGRSPSPAELKARAAEFTDAELRDLTVLFNLAWLGFAIRRGDDALAELEQRGRDYTDADLALVLERQRVACERVLPLWRALEARGQVELTSSPAFHPIIPLLIDSDHARRSLAGVPLPFAFSAVEDARAQIRRGCDAHRLNFGRAPKGMWPPEGSVSPEALSLYAEAGVEWLATDEGNLWRSLSSEAPAARGALYQAYRYAGVDLVFRDRELSDRVGFRYAHGDPQDGVEDLLRGVRDAGQAARAAGIAQPIVPIVLDGENPWESYAGAGEPFLRALFESVARDVEVEAVTVAGYLASTTKRVTLDRMHSGSWIDSDFHIWIGDAVKNRAWNALGHARKAWERARARGISADKLEIAQTPLLAAEGSDWFWWFGEPFHSAEDATFDRLFRAHLAATYRALEMPVPDEVTHPIGDGPAASTVIAPIALIAPRIGSSYRSFYAWQGAGRFMVPRGAAMFEAPLIETIYFGFDREAIYLRLDASGPNVPAVAECVVEIELTAPRKNVLIALPEARAVETQSVEGHEVTFARMPRTEARIPFALVDGQPSDELHLRVAILSGTKVLARVPMGTPLAITLPGPDFEATHWSV